MLSLLLAILYEDCCITLFFKWVFYFIQWLNLVVYNIKSLDIEVNEDQRTQRASYYNLAGFAPAQLRPCLVPKFFRKCDKYYLIID
jgi:hypothetical protein